MVKLKFKWSALIAFFAVIMVGFVGFTTAAHADTIKDRIMNSQNGSNGMSKLEEDVDKSTSSTVQSARRIFVSLAVAFGLWLALTYFRAGFSPDTLKETKGRIMFFLIFLILSFWTESLLGALFKFLGIELSEL